MISFWKKNKYAVIFIALFVIICLIYQYHVIIFLRPQGIHIWRQTIGLSFALNYYQHGMHFFMPEINSFTADGGKTGYTAAEFPLLYFFDACLWKIFGFHEFIPRLVNIVLVFFGFFFLFKMIFKVTDAFWGIFLTLFFFTSPALVFYSINTLPDGPAFGIALMGMYCFYMFFENQKYKWLYVFMFLSLLAGLLKATSAMVFASILLIFILEKIGVSFKTDRKIFNGGIKDYFLFIGVVIGIASWYFWAKTYNKTHGLEISDSRILPIWDMASDEIDEVIKAVHEINWYQFLCPHSTFIFLLLFIALFFLKNKVDKYWWFLTIILFTGSVTYILLWFVVWGNHDYYMFPLFFSIISIAVTFLHYLKTVYPEIHSSKILKTIFFLFFVYNVWYCGNNIRMRYGLVKGKSGEGFWQEVILTSTKTEIGFWDWYNMDHWAKWEAYQTIEPYNRTLGIQQNDLVISIPDESVCVSLYLMNQKGWTDYGSKFFEQGGIDERLKLGANYLFVNDTTHVNNIFIKPYTEHKIGQYKNIAVFDLRPYNKQNN